MTFIVIVMSFNTIYSINYGQRAARLGDTAFDNATIFPGKGRV